MAYNWINSKYAFTGAIPRAKEEPKVDEGVSHIVGKRVFVNDSKLIKKVAEWRRNKDPNSDVPDNFLQQERCRNELKELFK